MNLRTAISIFAILIVSGSVWSQEKKISKLEQEQICSKCDTCSLECQDFRYENNLKMGGVPLGVASLETQAELLDSISPSTFKLLFKEYGEYKIGEISQKVIQLEKVAGALACLHVIGMLKDDAINSVNPLVGVRTVAELEWIGMATHSSRVREAAIERLGEIYLKAKFRTEEFDSNVEGLKTELEIKWYEPANRAANALEQIHSVSPKSQKLKIRELMVGLLKLTNTSSPKHRNLLIDIKMLDPLPKFKDHATIAFHNEWNENAEVYANSSWIGYAKLGVSVFMANPGETQFEVHDRRTGRVLFNTDELGSGYEFKPGKVYHFDIYPIGR